MEVTIRKCKSVVGKEGFVHFEMASFNPCYIEQECLQDYFSLNERFGRAISSKDFYLTRNQS